VATNLDANWNQIGKRFILPSSFTRSIRYMQQHLQDALTINHFYEGGDLFITITANPSWPKIKDALLHGQTASDRPDIVVRVFHVKLNSLIKEIRRGVSSDWAAHLYTIEF
jgi:hypothetical protein